MVSQNEKYILKENASKHPHDVRIWAIGISLEKDEWVWNQGATFIVQAAHITTAEDEPTVAPLGSGVAGPSASVSGNIVTFLGTDGQEIQDSGSSISDLLGAVDGDRLSAPTTTKRGGVKATGTPSGKFYKDDDTWSVPASGGSAVLPFKTVGFTSGMDYVCDGTADNVQINAAIASMAATGGTIWLGPGTFVLAASIDMTGKPGIQILGTPASIIDATAITVGLLIDYDDGTGWATGGNFELRGFTLRRTSTNGSSIGIKILTTGNGDWGVIDHLWVYGFDKCIAALGVGTWPTHSSTGQVSITNCQIGQWSDVNRTSYGLYITRAIEFAVLHNNFSSFTQAGIYAERLDSSVIKDNIIISGNNYFGGTNPQYGIKFNPTASDQLIVDVEISGNAIENTYQWAIDIDGTYPLFQIFIHDNEINLYNGGILVEGTHAAAYSIHIYHNDIHGTRNGVNRNIWVINAYDVTIDHNTIDATGTQYGEGIRISTTSIGGGSITGNTIYRGATTQIGGIVVEGAIVSVTGNAFTGSGTLTYAIDLTATSSLCSVLGNVGTLGTTHNAGTSNIVPAGTNT